MWTMRARIAAVVVAAAVTTATAMLVRCSGSPEAIDGGDDSGSRIDVPTDRAIVLDAGADADSGPCTVASDWPGFRRLTEFDPCLPADVLVDQDAGYTMAWTDCGDAGIAGCQQLVQLVPQQFTVAYATYDDAGSGRALFLDQGLDNTSSIRQFDIVDLKSEARLGEWRIDVVPANGTEIVLPNTTTTTTAFLGWEATLSVDFAPAQQLSSTPLTLSHFPTAPNQDINWAISDQVMAFQPYASPYAICQVDAGTCAPMNIASIAPAVPYLTFAWHDVVFGVAEHGTTGWAQEYVIHADGSITLLRSNPNAHIWGMTTDGTTLVWEETYGSTTYPGPQTTTEVWKAPFTTDQATLTSTATKVTTLPTAGIGGAAIADLDFFNGLYATYLRPPADVIYVVDVATGQTQTVPKGPGGSSFGVLGLPYVDQNELWEVTLGPFYTYYLVRIPFAQPWL
jgi:hypothetical protein